MEITDKIIFDYIFFENEKNIKLERAIKEANKQYKFEEYLFIKQEIKKEIPIEVKKKLSEKIPLYSFNKKYELVEWKTFESGKMIFSDEGKIIIAEVNYGETGSLLNVFSPVFKTLENFSVELIPGEEKYYIEDNSNPNTIIYSGKNISKIIISFTD